MDTPSASWTGLLIKLEHLRQEERDGINWSGALDIVVDDAKQVALRMPGDFQTPKDIRDLVFNIDSPIGEAYYCSTVISHLLTYVGEVQDMKPVLLRIASDLESAVIETRRIFAELHERAVSGPDA